MSIEITKLKTMWPILLSIFRMQIETIIFNILVVLLIWECEEHQRIMNNMTFCFLIYVLTC